VIEMETEETIKTSAGDRKKKKMLEKEEASYGENLSHQNSNSISEGKGNPLRGELSSTLREEKGFGSKEKSRAIQLIQADKT